MLVEGVVCSKPVLASVGPDAFIESIENAVLGCCITFVPLGR